MMISLGFKGLELFSFDFSLPAIASSSSSGSCVACPNCGYQICNTILHKVSISKTAILFCCGSVIYWNYFHNNHGHHQVNRITSTEVSPRCDESCLISSLVSSARDGLMNVLSFITSRHSIPSCLIDQSSTTNVVNQYYQRQSNSIRNQLIVNNNNGNSNNNNNCYEQTNESGEFSSLNLSPLSSIGAGTLAKLDTMLDEVQEIKMYVKDSCNELHLFNGSNGIPAIEAGDDSLHSIIQSISDRRLSDGELTLPSLEWDLNDVQLAESVNGRDSLESLSSISTTNDGRIPITGYANNIDAEALSQIIFNKDFEFKDERFFKMKKQLFNLKQRLKYMSKSQQPRLQQQERRSSNNNNNGINSGLNSSNYRSNRDSAFFEEIP